MGHYNHNQFKKCRVEGCEELSLEKGVCPTCGQFRRKSLCQKHQNEKRENKKVVLRGKLEV